MSRLVIIVLMLTLVGSVLAEVMEDFESSPPWSDGQAFNGTAGWSHQGWRDHAEAKDAYGLPEHPGTKAGQHQRRFRRWFVYPCDELDN